MTYRELVSQASQITHLYADRKYTYMHVQDVFCELYSRRLSNCLKALLHFIRIYQSYGVNPHCMGVLGPSPIPRSAQLRVGELWLPVSRSRLKTVIQQMKQSV